MSLSETFKGKRVFLTGHTGFKGSWLLQILNHFGAIVKGYALAPENDYDLYNQIKGDDLCYGSVIADLKDAHLLKGEMVRFEPDFVFHLAAQPLVRYSYEYPVSTFETNVMGTVHVLEAMRSLQKPCIGIMVTTDKVYENNELGTAFAEEEKLGGHDPYSASKAACEIAIASYRNSFFHPSKYSEHQKSIAAVRAGNVIGGGDFAADRIIPDIVRAIEHNEDVVLRNPQSVRPWQHVLEPLFVYLSLAEKMLTEPVALSAAFNIGPEKTDILNVETVTQSFIDSFGKGTYRIQKSEQQLHEANLLMLDNQKIKATLNWTPLYNATQAIKLTADWYANKEQTAAEKCLQQINDYLNAM